MQFSINQKPNGQHLRVIVEQKPTDVTQLIELQHSIKAELPEFTPKEPEYIHLTLIHLGIPQDIYYELRRLNPDLTLDSFMARFMDLLQELHKYTQKPHSGIELEGESLNLYGSAKSPAVALSMVRNLHLDQLHREVFNILIRYVGQHLKSDPIAFIKSSRNFRHSPPEVFNPHITLGRITSQSADLPILSQPLLLTVGQPYLAHVTVI